MDSTIHIPGTDVADAARQEEAVDSSAPFGGTLASAFLAPAAFRSSDRPHSLIRKLRVLPCVKTEGHFAHPRRVTIVRLRERDLFLLLAYQPPKACTKSGQRP